MTIHLSQILLSDYYLQFGTEVRRLPVVREESLQEFEPQRERHLEEVRNFGANAFRAVPASVPPSPGHRHFPES